MGSQSERISRTTRMKSAGFMASTAKSASGSFFWFGPKRERIGALQLPRNSSRTLCFSTRGTEWANTSRSAWLRLRSLLVCSAPRIVVTRQPASLSSSSRVSARTGIQETQTTCFAAVWGIDKLVYIASGFSPSDTPTARAQTALLLARARIRPKEKRSDRENRASRNLAKECESRFAFRISMRSLAVFPRSFDWRCISILRLWQSH
jgi:hypothetical protein